MRCVLHAACRQSSPRGAAGPSDRGVFAGLTGFCGVELAWLSDGLSLEAFLYPVEGNFSSPRLGGVTGFVKTARRRSPELDSGAPETGYG